MVPVKIVIDRQIVAKISFGVPDILEMPGWEQVYEEPLLSKFCGFFFLFCSLDPTTNSETKNPNYQSWLNLRKLFTLAQISQSGCQMTTLSIIHLKKRCSGSWFGTHFWRFEPKLKTFWDDATFSKHCEIKYDKLYVDNEVYVWSDKQHKIERISPSHHRSIPHTSQGDLLRGIDNKTVRR